MLSLTILKRSKGGTYYIEIDSSIVQELELTVGDTLQLYTEEIWIFDKSKKVCTLRGINASCYDSVKDLLSGTKSKNLAKNRQDT